MLIPDDRALEIAIEALARRAMYIAEDRGHRRQLVAQLHREGMPVEDICAHTALQRKTVTQYIREAERGTE